MAVNNNNNAGSSSAPTIVTGVEPPQKPLNLLNAVSEIQQYCALESDMVQDLNKNYFTTQNLADFTATGLKAALNHFLFTIFFTPLTVAVLHQLIPLFGEEHSTFNTIYSIILAFSLSFGYGAFLASLRGCYIGVMAKNMIKSLFSGLLIGEILKVFVSIGVYIGAFMLFTPKRLAEFTVFIFQHFGTFLTKTHLTDQTMFLWLYHFRNVFPMSIVFIIISAILMIGFPSVAVFIFGRSHNKKPDEKLEEIN